MTLCSQNALGDNHNYQADYQYTFSSGHFNVDPTTDPGVGIPSNGASIYLNSSLIEIQCSHLHSGMPFRVLRPDSVSEIAPHFTVIEAEQCYFRLSRLYMGSVTEYFDICLTGYISSPGGVYCIQQIHSTPKGCIRGCCKRNVRRGSRNKPCIQWFCITCRRHRLLQVMRAQAAAGRLWATQGPLPSMPSPPPATPSSSCSGPTTAMALAMTLT